MNFENIFKGIITTLIGAAIMGSAYYGWYTDHLNDSQGIVAGLLGFAMLWMRDKMPEYIGNLFSAIISKFSAKK